MKMKQLLLVAAAMLGLTAAAVAQNSSDKKDLGNSSKSKMFFEYNSHYFEENMGQIRDQFWQPRKDIFYSLQTKSINYFLSSEGISYQVKNQKSNLQKYPNSNFLFKQEERDGINEIYRVDATWINSNQSKIIKKENPVLSYNNYYNVPDKDHASLNVKQFRKITYQNVWDGIDIKFFKTDDFLETDYWVQPGADYRQIKIQINGGELSTDYLGNLLIKTPFGIIKEGTLKVYQNGHLLPAKWVINDSNVISFDIKDYNPELALHIDPLTQLWGTYFGGNNDDVFRAISKDNLGNIYVSGDTRSTANIATTGAYQTTFNGGYWDAIIVKYNSEGIRQWSTYFGGSGNDQGYDIAVFGNNNIYLTGEAGSQSGVSTSGAHQTNYGGSGRDGFLAKFNEIGLLQWSTYYGGGSPDVCIAVTCDNSGNVFITGETGSSNNIATSGASQENFNGGSYDPFIAKFNSSGVRLWGTYCGGNSDELGASLCTDSNGNVYMAGYGLTSNGISTSGAYQELNGGGQDVILVKFSPTGNKLWGTYFGGSGNDFSSSNGSIIADMNGNIYLTGVTSSLNAIATPGAFQTTFNQGNMNDGFLAKFSNNGSIQWSTYFGGSENDESHCVAVDSFGNPYIFGWTASNVGIATNNTLQSIFGGGSYDVFFAKFSNSGINQWASYYGGSGDDFTYNAILEQSNIYFVGSTTSASQISSPLSEQPNNGGAQDGFLVKLNESVNCTFFDTVTTYITIYDTITTNLIVYDTITTTLTVYDTVTTYLSVTDTLVIQTILTSLNPPNNNTLKIFPNPASDHITIHYGNYGLMNGYQLRIENALGQQVFQTNIVQQSDYLSLSNWGGNGLYFVHLINPQGNTVTVRKIVLQ